MKLANQQEPLQEAAERLAEGAAARQIPFLVYLRDQIVNLADYRKRTREGYEAQADAAGHKAGKGGDEVPGDISVSGDSVHEHKHYAAPQEKSLFSKAIPYIATAALTAGALNGGQIIQMASGYFGASAGEAEYEIRFYDADGNPVKVDRYDPSNKTQ